MHLIVVNRRTKAESSIKWNSRISAIILKIAIVLTQLFPNILLGFLVTIRVHCASMSEAMPRFNSFALFLSSKNRNQPENIEILGLTCSDYVLWRWFTIIYSPVLIKTSVEQEQIKPSGRVCREEKSNSKQVICTDNTVTCRYIDLACHNADG